jgi:hypothetical protein
MSNPPHKRLLECFSGHPFSPNTFDYIEDDAPTATLAFRSSGLYAGQSCCFSTCCTVNNIARLFKDQGKLDKVEEMYKHALEGCNRRFWSDHLRFRSLRRDLGTLQGRVVA